MSTYLLVLASSVFLYSFILISLGPFLLVNGVLTGLLDSVSPPVWYNDSENLGLRLMTIPVEEFSIVFHCYFLARIFLSF